MKLTLFTLVLLCHSLSHSSLVHANIIWQLNQSFSIQASSPSFPIFDPQAPATLYPFYPEIQQVSSLHNASTNSPAFIFPGFFESPSSHSSNTLSSTMFVLCMSGVAPYQEVGPLKGIPVVLWVANRATPARGKNVSLILQPDGDLVVRGYGNDGGVETTAWRSNTSGKGVTRMELSQYPANLILYDVEDTIIWQSMDYPADTLCIGQSLGVGTKLVSRAWENNISEGMYSLVVESVNQLSLIYKKDPSADSIPYWMWRLDDVDRPSWSLGRSSCRPPGCALSAPVSGELFSIFITSEGLSAGYSSNHSTIQEFAYPIPKEDLQTTFLRLEWNGNLRLCSMKEQRVTLVDLFSGETECLLPQSCGPYGVCVGSKQCKCPDVGGIASVLSLRVPSFVPLDLADPAKGCGLDPPLPTCNNATLAAGTHNNSSQDQQVQMLMLKGVDYFSYVKNSVPILDVAKDDQGYNCSNLCLHNCTCLAAFWSANLSACFHISQQQMGSLRGGLNTTIYRAYLKVSTLPAILPPSPSPFQPPIHHNNIKKIATGIGIGLGAFVIACASVFFMYRKGYINGSGLHASVHEEHDVLGNAAMSKLPTRFSYAELHAVTNGFSHMLGKGGFGSVYAGILADGTTKVAVKKLEGMRQGEKEFKTELAIMAGIHHYNLLQLMGYCAEGADSRLLVYKYMENGSLDQWLFASSSATAAQINRFSSGDEEGDGKAASRLKWGLRYEIAVGVAKGLAYLHEGCEKRIIHLDVKPQNILLDDSFVAKVADFGLSRGMNREESHVVTTMRGTPGYLAPEWVKDSTIDVKCDVFSFGMLLMEIVSGRKNLDIRQSEAPFYPEWAYSQLISNKILLGKTDNPSNGPISVLSHINDNSATGQPCILDRIDSDNPTGPKTLQKVCSIDALTDAELESEQDRAQLRRLIMIAFLCVMERPEWRPSMGKVVQMLEGLIPVSHIELSSLYQGLAFVLGSHDSSSSNVYKRGAVQRRHEFQQQLESLLAVSSTSSTATCSDLSQLSGR